jgi:hypothetical protein
MTEQKTCEELINSRLIGTLENLLPDWDDMSDEDIQSWASDLDIDPADHSSDDLIDALRERHRDRELEDVLSVDKVMKYTVLLSWGGPSDGFDFEFTGDELTGCYYWYKDWFDGARRPVPMDQAEQLVNLYCVGPEFE